jgi:hypothetical protein
MARFEQGWFRLDRRAVFEDIGQNLNCLGLWVWLLAMATTRETRLRNSTSGPKIIPAGTVVTSYRDLADLTGAAINTIKEHLRYLKNTGRITIESDARGTIVTILNWYEYQAKWADEAEEANPPANTSTNTPSDTAIDTPPDTASHTQHETSGDTKADHLLNEVPFTSYDLPPTSSQGSPEGAPQSEVPPKGKRRRTTQPKEPAKTAAIWEAYCEEYETRHKVLPLDGAPIRGQMAQLLNRVPAAEVPGLVRFYVQHNDAFYVKNKHSFGLCLRDAQKLYTEWKTGNITTTAQAQAGEKYDSTVRAAKSYFNRKHNGAVTT